MLLSVKRCSESQSVFIERYLRALMLLPYELSCAFSITVFPDLVGRLTDPFQSTIYLSQQHTLHRHVP